MSQELIFYTHPMSRGRTVRWLLEEIGVPYQTEYLEYGPVMAEKEYLAINPMGKVPALKHKGVVITETAAICAYLADAFPEAKMSPAFDDPQRGTYFRWLFFAAAPLEAIATNKFLGVTTPKEAEFTVGYGNIDLITNSLKSALSQGDYLLGDQISAADIYLCAGLDWFMAFDLIESLPIFKAYCEHLKSRPACIRATAIDDELIASGQFQMPS